MKKIKLFLICTLAICMVSCAFAACGGTAGGESSVNSESKSEAESTSVAPSVDYKDGEYVMLDFETLSDLYKVRPYIPDILDIYGSISVVTEKDAEGKAIARSGSGSLKYAYESGKKPSLVFYPAHSDYPDMPIEKLVSFGVSVFSTAENEQKITLGVVSDKEPVYEEERTLAPGWNDYVFDLDPVLVKFRKDDIKAFCIGFDTGAACEYYLDKWTATVGEKTLTEVQNTAIAFAEKVDELDNGTPSTDGLLVAYGYYEKLDEACKSAVGEYYDTYKKVLRRILDSKSWDKEDDGSSIVAYLSENYGILQVGKADGMTYEYSSDAFGSGNGGTKFTFDGFGGNDEGATPKDAELKFSSEITTATIIVDSYDYIAFSVKNSSDKPVTICFNGSSNGATIEAGQTANVELPVTDLVETGNVLTFAFDYKTGETAAAEVIVSSLKVKALSRDNVYVSALENAKYSADGNSEVSRSGDKYSLAFKNAEGKITAVKAYSEINVSQNVSFSVVADKTVNVGMYAANGEKITDATASGTASVINLSKAEFEALSYFKADEACVLTVSDMLLSRAVDNDYAEIVLKNDYVVMANAVTTENAREAIYFVSSFESLSRSKQNYMKSNDQSVYSDITARAEKVSVVFKSAVGKVESGTATDVENMLVSDLSGQYSVLKSVTPLTKDELKTIESAKRGEFLKYKYTVFDFENPMATSNFGKVTRWFDWSGNISVENFDGGKKMAVGVQKVMPDGDNNARRIFISYDFSQSASALSGYDYVSWRIYNANAGDKTLFFVTYGWGSTVYSCTLKANRWTDVKLSVNDFKNAGYFVIYPTDPGEKFYIDNVYACSAEYVQSLVDSLPNLSDMTAEDREQVETARKEYEKLSALAKKKVDITKLTAAEKRISELPYKVFDMSRSGITEKFTHPTNIPNYLWDGTFGVENTIYGKALAIKAEGSTGGQPVVYLGYELGGVTLAGYDYVNFKVHNPKNAILDFAVITMGWGSCPYRTKLAAKGWTEITLPVSSFVNAGYFYIANVEKNEKVTFYITDIVAESASSIQAMINALPAAADVTKADTEAIMAARTAYNKLSASAKNSVDISKLEAAEAKLAEIPYTLIDMSSAGALGSFSHPTDIPAYLWDGDFSITDDETHGKVLAVHTTGTTGTSPVLYFGYNIGSADLSNYSKITLSVYNPKTVELDIAFITRGWGACSYRTKLAASGWTEITLTVEQFESAGYVYIANVEKNEEVTFLVTDIIAHN